MRSIYALGFVAAFVSQTADAKKKDECSTKVAPGQTSRANEISGLRPAAQKGLDFLVRSSKAWTKQHKCYGCHVQAVTLEGLTVGRHNQYKVESADIQEMVRALRLGVTAGGRKTGAAFQGAAWARYDQWIDDEATDDLLKYGRELIQYQTPDGAVQDDDRRPPVVAGTMQTTFQAMQTWRQAHARTADDIWLTPMRKAEGYLTKTARSWKPKQEISILDVNYALMGLVAAGVKSSEPTSMKLQKNLLARQNRDGGFGLTKKQSDALATGQTLYALKLAGYGDREPAIARGMRYLVSKQTRDGSWRTVSSSQGGAERGEAMWAVLGLVSVDVVSIALEGVRDGQRIEGNPVIKAKAIDNRGKGIKKMEVFLDDLIQASKCGSELDHRVSTEGLPDGRHYIDVVATNQEGKTSSRRIEIYSGEFFMTHVGTRFDEQRQTTEISLRNIAPTAKQAGSVRIKILDEQKKKPVFQKDVKGEMGAMTIPWKGEKRGRFVAEVSFVDAAGKVRQTETTVFFHDSRKVQQETFGEVQGRLSTARGRAGVAADAIVELVDEKGQVVQSTRSTDQGNYRFKNVDKGKYKIRVKKRGFTSEEAEVEAAPRSAPVTADVHLH